MSSYVQKTSFKELMNGDMKRLRQKQQYKDILLEGRNYIDFIVNKAKIKQNLDKITKENVKKQGDKEVLINIDNCKEAIDNSIELHKLIMHQILLNQQIKNKEKEKQLLEEKERLKEIEREKEVARLLKQNANNNSIKNEPQKFKTMYLYDKDGKNCVKFISTNDSNKPTESSKGKESISNRKCGCVKKRLERSKSLQGQGLKFVITTDKAVKAAKNPVKKPTYNFDKNTSLEDLQKMKNILNKLIDEKIKEVNGIIEENEDAFDKNNSINLDIGNINKNPVSEKNDFLSKTERIKENLMKEKEESDLYLRELNQIILKNSNSNLRSSQSTNYSSTNNIHRSSSAKEITSYASQKVIDNNYFTNAIKHLRKLKKNSYLRESHCNLYKPNDIFYITPTKQKLKEDKQFLPISHYKVNPFPKTARKYDFNEGNLWVTDAFLEKMRKAGTLSPETEMKIKSFTLKPPSDNYYLNLMVKDLIDLNYKNKESQ